MVQTEIYAGCWRDHDRLGKPFFTGIWTTGVCEDHRNAVP